MRPPTGREQAVIGVLVTILVAVVAFQFGSNAKSVSNDAAKAPQAQKQARRATVKATQAQVQGNQIVKCLLNSRGPKRAARCLNLTLPNPQPGPTGQAGQPGRRGLPGAQGSPGSQGLPGLRGPKGDPGSPGQNGQNGAPCLASIDPECVGPKGDTGAQGDKGAPGDAGATGAPGAKGDTGAQGATGDTGAPGSTGAQGPPGDPGPQGPQGATGPQGPPGANGSPPASFSFTFVDGVGAQVTLTCTDPDGDLNYTCSPG